MRTSTVTIRIADPCHENWENMKPETKGRYCSSCEKVVVDFTDKTNQEIHSILLDNQNQKMCGRFRKNQVDRPLTIKLDPHSFYFPGQPRKLFIAALLLVFGTSLISCYDHQDNKMAIEQIKVPSTSEGYMGLFLSDENIETAPAVEIVTGKTRCESEILGDVGFIVDEPQEEKFIPPDSLSQSNNIPSDTAIKKPFRNKNELYMLGGMSAEFTEDESEEKSVINDSLQRLSDLKNDNVFDDQMDLKVYPNPSDGQFFVRYLIKERCDVVLDLFDQQGRKLLGIVETKQQHTGEYHIPVDLSSFGADVYLLRLVLGEKVISSRVVVRK